MPTVWTCTIQIKFMPKVMNTTSATAIISFALGSLATASVCLALFYGSTVFWPLCFYVASLCVFHQLEFLMTSIYHPERLSVDCMCDIYAHISIHTPYQSLSVESFSRVFDCSRECVGGIHVGDCFQFRVFSRSKPVHPAGDSHNWSFSSDMRTFIAYGSNVVCR